jgi:hypothetical protein
MVQKHGMRTKDFYLNDILRIYYVVHLRRNHKQETGDHGCRVRRFSRPLLGFYRISIHHILF